MTKATRRPLFAGAAALLLAAFATLTPATASAQAKVETPLDRQLSRFDLGISGSGEFTSNSSGSVSSNQTLTLHPSTTLGVLVTLRYIKSPLVGFEFNYNRARYTQNFVYTNITPTATGTTSTATVLGVQNNATEYSFGYVAHAPRHFGFEPFASVGAGTTAFRPTTNGNVGVTPQARATYYYSVGGEELVYGSHLGLRASFRQAFSNAPDFQATYLRDHQRQVDSEPTIGIFLRY